MSAPALRPLLFRPVYKDYLWGGGRIAERFGRADVPSPCAESWEASAHPDGPSVVEGGPFDGRTLAELCETFGPALLGTDVEGTRFPLLVKLIDAKGRLSVQVHPSDEGAAAHGGEAKTEAWYFLDGCGEDAFVCAGFKPGVGPRVFADAVKDKSVASLLRTLPAVPGKALYVPGGLVHAIGEGCLVLEVQQNSNTTWRVYDWDRLGADGRPRELHVARATEVIDWRAPEPALATPYSMPSADPANVRMRVLRSDYFTLERWTLRAPESLPDDGRTFRLVFAVAGPLLVRDAGGETPVPAGRTCLLPASLSGASVAPAAGAESADALVVGI